MWGFQAAGAAPIVLGEPVDHPETIATAIRIGNPASWDTAVAARDESGGRIESVTDDEILAAYRLVACHRRRVLRAGVRGVRRRDPQVRRLIFPSGPIVCTLTGHGLKDPGHRGRFFPGFDADTADAGSDDRISRLVGRSGKLCVRARPG